MAKPILVIVEIEADGANCGPCTHKRKGGAIIGIGGRDACRLFGGFITESRRTDACLKAEMDCDIEKTDPNFALPDVFAGLLP